MAEWIKLQADDFEATVPVQSLLAFSASYIGTMVEFELRKGLPNPAVRLNCSAEEAREVVALLRQGKHYEPPRDNPRLMSALSRTLDFLGLPSFAGTTSNSQEVLLVPSYVVGEQHIEQDPQCSDEQFGLLMYSAGSQGWANKNFSEDPRPQNMRSRPATGAMGRLWLASVLPTEATGAGEDLIYMIPDRLETYSAPGSAEQPVLMRASLKSSPFAQPPQHQHCDRAAMAAAGGKLYLYGGAPAYDLDDLLPEAAFPDPSTLEVYDPHLGTWFAASSPPYEGACLVDHAMVSNKPGGMLLVIGGRLKGYDHSDNQEPAGWQWDGLALYDINAGKWSSKPESKFPAAGMPQGSSLSAVSVGDSTVMVISKAFDPPAAPANPAAAAAAVGPARVLTPARVDLLDLRMMRWRAAAPLPYMQQHLHGISLVEYDGKVMAVGGAKDTYTANEGFGSAGSCYPCVSVYDERNDSWSEMPALLPIGISYSTPVVVRAPSTLQ